MQESDLGAVALKGRLTALEEQLHRKDYAHERTRVESRDLHQLCVKTRTMTNQIEETVAKALLDLLIALKRANGATPSELTELEKEENGIKLVAHIKNTFVHYDTDHSFGFSFTEFASAFRGLGIQTSDKKMRSRFDTVQRGGSVEEDDFITAILKHHPDVSIDRFFRDLHAEVRKLARESSERASTQVSENVSTASQEEFDKLKSENEEQKERITSMKYELKKMNAAFVNVNKKMMGDMREKEMETEVRNQDYAHYKSQQMLLDNTQSLLEEKKNEIKRLRSDLADARDRQEELELQFTVLKGQQQSHESEQHLLQQRLMEAQGESARLKSFAKNCRFTMSKLEDLYLRNVHATVLKLKQIQDKSDKEIKHWMKDRKAISMLSEIKDVFVDLDVEQNREMDFSKFCQAWQRFGVDIPHAGLNKLWSQIDVEEIGYITEDQFENAVMGTSPDINIISYTEVLADHLDEMESWANDVKDRSKNDELLKDISDLKFAVQHADEELKKYREQCEHANSKLKPLSEALPISPAHKKRNSVSLRNLDDIDELPYTVDRVCAQGNDLNAKYDALKENRDDIQKELLSLQQELDTLIAIPDVEAESRANAPPKPRRSRSRIDIKDLQDTMAQLKSKLNLMRQNNDLLIRQKKVMEEEHKKEIEKLKQEQEELAVKLEMVAIGADLNQNDLKDSKDTLAKIRGRIDALKEELDKKEKENEDLLKQIADMRADQSASQDTQQTEKEGLEKKIKDLEETISGQVEEAKVLQEEVDSNQKELKEKDEHLVSMLADLETLHEKMKDLSQNLQEVEESRLLGEEERSLLESSMEEKEEELKKMQEVLLGHEAKLAAQEATVEHLHAVLEEHEVQMSETQASHLTELQEHFDVMNEVHEENKSLKDTIEKIQKDEGDRNESLQKEVDQLKAEADATKTAFSEYVDPWEGWPEKVEAQLDEFVERHVEMKLNLQRLKGALSERDEMIENLEERLKQMSSNADEKTRSMDGILAEKNKEVDSALEAQRTVEVEKAALEEQLKAAEDETADIKDEMQAIQESKAAISDEKEELEKKIKAMIEEFREEKEDFEKKLEEKSNVVKDLEEQIEGLQDVNSKNLEEKKDLEKKLEDNSTSLKVLEEKLMGLNEENSRNLKNMDEMNANLVKDKEDLEKSSNVMKDLEAKIKELQEKNSKNLEDLSKKEAAVLELEEKFEVSINLTNDLKEKLKELEEDDKKKSEDLSRREIENENLQESVEDLKEKLKGLQEERSKNQEDLLKKEAVKKDLERRLEESANAVEEQKRIIDDLEEDKERLEERLAQMSMNASEQSKNLDAKLAEKNEEMEARENAMEALEDELKKLRKAGEKKDEDIAELMKSFNELTGAMDEQTKIAEKLQASVEGLMARGEEDGKSLEEMEKLNSALREDALKGEKSIGEMEETIDNLVGDFNKHLEDKEHHEHEHGVKVAELKGEKEEMMIDRENLEKELNELHGKLEETENLRKKEKEDLEVMKQILEEKSEELSEVNVTLNDMNEKLQEKAKEIDVMGKEREENKEKLLKMEEEMLAMMEKVEKMNALEEDLEVLKKEGDEKNEKLLEMEEEMHVMEKKVEEIEALEEKVEAVEKERDEKVLEMKEELHAMEKKVQEMDALEENVEALEKERDEKADKLQEIEERFGIMEEKVKQVDVLEKDREEKVNQIESLEEEVRGLKEEGEGLKEVVAKLEAEILESQDLVNKVKELEDQVKQEKALAKQATDALETEKSARVILTDKVSDQSKSILNLHRANDTSEEKYKILLQKKDLVDEELNEIREVLKEKEKEIEDLHYEIGARDRKESDMGEATDRLSRNLQRIEAEKSKAAKRLSTASQELSLKDKKLVDLEKQNKDLEETVEDLKESKKKLKLDLKVKTKEGEAKDLEIKEKEDEIKQKEDEMERLKAEVEKLDEAQKSVGQLEDEAVDLKQEIENLEERLNNALGSNNEKTNELDRLLAEKQDEVDAIGDKMEGLERKVKDLEREHGDLEAEKDALVEKVGALAGKVELLEEKDDKNDEIVKLKDEQLEEMEKALSKEKEKSEELEKSVESLEKKLGGAEAKKEELDKLTQAAEDELEKLKEENSRLSASLAGKEKEAQALKEELERMKADLEKLDQSHLEKDEHIEKLSNEIEDALSQLQNKKQDIEDQQARSTHEKEAMAVDINRLRKEVDALKNGSDQKDKELQQLGEDMDTLQDENECLKKDLQDLQEEADRAKDMDKVRDELKAEKSEKNKKASELDRLKTQLKELVAEEDAMEKKIEALTASMKQKEADIEQLSNQVKDRDEQIQQKQEEIQELEAALKAKDTQNSQLQEVAGTEHAELEDLRKDVKRLKSDKASLEKDRDNLMQEKEELVDDLRQKDLEIRELLNKNEVLGGLVAEHEDELEKVAKLTLEIDDLTKKNVKLKAALTQQENENQDLSDKLKATSRTRSFAPKREDLEQVQKLQDSNDQLKSEVDALKSKNNRMGRDLNSKDAEIEALKEVVDEANRTHDEIFAKVQEKDREIAKMKDKLAETPDGFSKAIPGSMVEDEIVFDDDFFALVQSKNQFLLEFNDFIEDAGIDRVAAFDVYPGSIKVKLRGDPDQIAKLKDYIAKNGISLPSTGPLNPSKKMVPNRLEDQDKAYNPDRDPPMMDLRKQLADALAEIERLKRLLNREKERVKAVTDEAESVKKENERLKRNFAENYTLTGEKSDIEALNDRIRTLMHHNDNLTDNIKSKSEEVVGLRDKLDEVKENQIEMDRKLREIGSKLDEARDVKDKLEDDNQEQRQKLKQADEKMEDFREDLENAKAQAHVLRNELSDKDTEVRRLKASLDYLTQEKNGIENNPRTAYIKEESDLRALNNKLEDLTNQNYELRQNLRDTGQQIDKLKTELKQKEDKIDEMNALKEKIDELQMEEIQRLREQIQELENVQDSLQNSLINRDTEINNLLEKIQQAKYTQDQYKQKLLKKKRDLEGIIHEIARAELEEKALKQTLAKKEAQIDSLREKVDEMNHAQEELKKQLEAGEHSLNRFLSDVKTLKREKESLKKALVRAQDENLETGRKMEDVERELRKLRDDLTDREHTIRELVEKLKSRKVDYKDLESILRDKNQEIDYLRNRLDDARNTEQNLRREARRRDDADRLGRLGPSPMSLSMPPTPATVYSTGNVENDSNTGLSPKDNFLKAIKDVLGIQPPASPQAVIRGVPPRAKSVQPYRSAGGEEYRSGMYAYNVETPTADTGLEDFMQRLRERRQKKEHDDTFIEEVIQKILSKVKQLAKENDRIMAELQQKDNQLKQISKEIERLIDPSKDKTVEFLYAPSPTSELVPRLVQGITRLKEENSDLKAEVRQLKRNRGLQPPQEPSRGPSIIREYIPSKAAELVPSLMQSKLALQEKNGKLLQYVHDLENSLRRKDEPSKRAYDERRMPEGSVTPLGNVAPPDISARSILEKLKRRNNKSKVAELVPKLIESNHNLREQNSKLKGDRRKRKYDLNRLNGKVSNVASPKHRDSGYISRGASPTPKRARQTNGSNDWIDRFILYETVVEKLVLAVEELKRRNFHLQSDLDNKENKVRSQASEIERLKNKVGMNSDALKSKEKEHIDFKRKMREKLEVVGTLKNKIGDLRAHRVNMVQNRDALQEKNHKLERKVAQLEEALKMVEEAHSTRSVSSYGRPVKSTDEFQQSQVKALLKTVKDQEEIVERIQKKNASLLGELGDQSHAVGYLARMNREGDPDQTREWSDAELRRLRNRVQQLATLKEDLEIKQREIVSLQDAMRIRDLTMEKLTARFNKKLYKGSISIQGKNELSSLLTTINMLAQVTDFFANELKSKDGEIETLHSQLEDRQKEVAKLRGKIRKKKAAKGIDFNSIPEKGDLVDLMKEYRKEIVRLRSFSRELRTKMIELEEKACTEFRDVIRKLLSRQGAPMKELQNHDKNRYVTLIAQLRQAYVDFDHKHHMKLSYSSFLEACKSMGISIPQHKLKKRFEKYSINGRDLRESEFVCAVLDRPESELGIHPYSKHLSDLISGRSRANRLPIKNQHAGASRDAGASRATPSSSPGSMFSFFACAFQTDTSEIVLEC